jgi:hypothetical protein
VTKLAEDRAEQFKREPDRIVKEIDKRIRADLRNTGDFDRVHPFPLNSQEVPDDLDARLVVLGIDHAYAKEAGCAAEIAAKAILENRGNSPRLYRNTLVFLAADKTRLQDLDEAVRRFLAWDSILAEKMELNLDPQQVKQAEAQRAAANDTVTARIPETYQWLLVPIQKAPQSPLEWQAVKLNNSGDGLAARAGKKLRGEELLMTTCAATRLRMELDRVPLWSGNHVAIKQLAEHFARYLYLPRLKSPAVLLDGIRSGLSLLTWHPESFAYADSFDEATGRYRGLRGGQGVMITDADAPGLLVKPEVAKAQMDAERSAADGSAGPTGTETAAGTPNPGDPSTTAAQPTNAGPVRPKRFHGTVTLDPARVGRDASKIADEVIAHIAGLVGAKVKVTLELEAEIPSGAPDHVVRTVTENSRTLKFTSHGFERD